MIIFSEVMFDKKISGELPEHIDFVKNRCIPLFESWGYKVKILHSDRTYKDCFYHIITKSKKYDRIGKYKGFAMSGHCDVQRDCKLRAIKNFWKEYKEDHVCYIGIATDETQRISRIQNNVSLLVKYGYTEQMCFDLCKRYDLLSPSYLISNRGGGVGFAQI